MIRKVYAYLVVSETPGNPDNPDDQGKTVVHDYYWSQGPATTKAKRYARTGNGKKYHVYEMVCEPENGRLVKTWDNSNVDKK